MNDYLINAEWITAQEAGEKENRYIEFLCEFEADSPEAVRLFYSVTGSYAVYVNEIFVDCGQLHGYEDYQITDSLSLGTSVRTGKNTLKLQLYDASADFSTQRRVKTGAVFALWQGERCIYSSAPDCLSRPMSGYQSGEVERVSPQLGYSFRYQETGEEQPYRQSILAGKKKALFARMTKKLTVADEITGMLVAQGVFLDGGAKQTGERMQHAFLSSRTAKELLTASDDGAFSWQVSQEENADGIYLLLDMGEESVGYAALEFWVPEDCDVLIGYGEHLSDLRVRAYVGGRNFCGLYHARAGYHKFFHPFLRLGLRYMQLHIYSRTGKLYQAGIRKTWYPIERQEYRPADGLHRRIYETGVKTLLLCMHEHYEDCPWREQSLYTFDSRIQMLCGFYAFREKDYPKASLRLIADSLREDHLLELCAPGKVGITIPVYSAVFVRQVLEYYQYTGDGEFVNELFPVLYQIVQGFADRIEENGLVACYTGNEYWNFYEWEEGLDGSEYFDEEPPYECPLNAMISDAFRCFAVLSGELAPELSDIYQREHDKLNEALHRSFYDGRLGVYRTRLGRTESNLHVLTQALALQAEAVPKELKPALLEHMISGELIPCSLCNYIYVFEALLSQGERYRGYVRQEIERIWGRMLFMGATSFWETEDGEADFKNAGSLCHGWSATPVYIYRKYKLLEEE